MKVTLLLADAAEAVNGKLYIIGGGWSVCGPGPTPMAIAMKIDVPWDQTNKPHSWQLSLLSADGEIVTVPTPEGDQAVRIDGNFEVGRPPGVVPGTPIDISMAIGVGPLPLAPGSRYLWQLSIDHHTDENWQLGFTVRKQPEPQPKSQ
jgi:hypothetical protein